MLRWGIITIALACAISGRAVAQDAAAGEKDFMVCRACHQVGPTAKDGVGPVLNGVVGRKAGTFDRTDMRHRSSASPMDYPLLIRQETVNGSKTSTMNDSLAKLGPDSGDTMAAN